MAFVWLLNALDGIGSGEEGIVILTMNYQDKLDEALIRPGRVDFEAYLGHMSQKSAEEIFLRMFEPGLLESGHAHFERSDAEGPVIAIHFADEIAEGRLIPSHLQSFFPLHLDDAAEATANMGAWVQSQLAAE